MRTPAIVAFWMLGCGTGLDEGATPPPPTGASFEESFESAGALTNWVTHADCDGTYTADWEVRSGSAWLTGNCKWTAKREAGSKVNVGTWLSHKTARFSTGWLVARVRPGDDDGIGLIWGNEHAFYRLSVLREPRRYALLSLITEPGYDFAGNPAPERKDFGYLPLALTTRLEDAYPVWLEIAVERTGGRTTAYIDHKRVVSFQGGPPADGPVGVYGWAMSELEVDHVAVYPNGPPPWERERVPVR